MSRISLLMLLLTFATTRSALAQHVHEQHPVTLHGGDYHRTSLEGSGHSDPVVALDSSGSYLIFNEWLINSSCMKVKRGNSYTRSVTHRVHVQITGEVEWGVEAGAKLLAAELKTYSKARVELNGGWSGEWKEELGFTSVIDLKPCQKVWYVFMKNRRKASGFIDTWDHKITCIHRSTSKLAPTYCNKQTLKGTGVGWGTHIGEHVQRGLVKACPCSDIDPDTKHVFDPTVPVPVPEVDAPVPTDDDNETNSPPAPEKEPNWILMNPLEKDQDGKKDE